MSLITVDFLTAVSVASTVFLLSMAVMWLRGGKDKRGEGAGLIDPRFVWVCGVCTYNYVNTRDESLSVCPRCGSYNKK